MYYNKNNNEFNDGDFEAESNFIEKMWEILLVEPMPVDIILTSNLKDDDVILWLN